MSELRHVVTEVHGRYLVERGEDQECVIGFHGYAQTAAEMVEPLRLIAPRATRICPEGLHHFYRGRSSEVVASWMTRVDRELAIADNIAYLRRVIESEESERTCGGITFCGFSQGAAMAYRASAAFSERCRGVIVLGGDLPPDVPQEALARIQRVLIGRGSADDWYSEDKLASDEERLRGSGVALEVFRFNGGHEWNEAFITRARQWIEEKAQSPGVSAAP